MKAVDVFLLADYFREMRGVSLAWSDCVAATVIIGWRAGKWGK